MTSDLTFKNGVALEDRSLGHFISFISIFYYTNMFRWYVPLGISSYYFSPNKRRIGRYTVVHLSVCAAAAVAWNIRLEYTARTLSTS